MSVLTVQEIEAEEAYRLLEQLPSSSEIEEEFFLREVEQQIATKAAMGSFDDLPGLSRIASRLEPKTRTAFLRAVQKTANQMELEQLATAIQSGSIERVAVESQLETFRQELGKLGTPITDGFLRGAEFANKNLQLSAGTALRFDLVNPHAVSFAQRNTLQLVETLMEGAEAQIQTVLGRAMSGELTAVGAAREIRQSVGLTKRDTTFLDKFTRQLRERDVPAADIARRTQRMSESLVRRRSLVIARTELIRAANAGQQALWMEGVSQGLIDKQGMVRKWIVTHDDRLDAVICEPLDQVEASLTEPFTHPVLGTTYMFPPAHPQCRCSVIRVVRRPENEV